MITRNVFAFFPVICRVIIENTNLHSEFGTCFILNSDHILFC